MTDFKTLLKFSIFSQSSSRYFYSVIIHFKFGGLIVLFVVFSRIFIFLFALNNRINLNCWLLFLFLFFPIDFKTFWYFVLFFLDGLFGKVSLSKLVQDLRLYCLFSVFSVGIIFGYFFNSRLLIVLVQFSNSIGDSSAIQRYLPKLIVWVIQVNFLVQVEFESSNYWSLWFHFIRN